MKEECEDEPDQKPFGKRYQNNYIVIVFNMFNITVDEMGETILVSRVAEAEFQQ